MEQECNRVDDEMRAPQRVDLPARVRLLAGGAGHACAATDDGHVSCWGIRTAHAKRDALQRADVQPPVPQTIESLPPVRELAGGLFHMCAVTADGAVYCWGGNHFGQLGDGSERDSATRAIRVLAPGSIDVP